MFYSRTDYKEINVTNYLIAEGKKPNIKSKIDIVRVIYARTGGKMNFTEMIEKNTTMYLKKSSKETRKNVGQFFTPRIIAEYMGGLSTLNEHEVHILDAGAGTGILTAALIDVLISKTTKKIIVDQYETGKEVIPILKNNMDWIKNELNIKNIEFQYNIIEKDFIESNSKIWCELEKCPEYDIVISNPPYQKIMKESIQSKVMNDIVFGQPNLYFLFMAMASKLVKDQGELIFITPRSFTSGLYFNRFRKWMLNEVAIDHIHIFSSRDQIFSDEVLQETIILKARNSTEKPDNFTISVSNRHDDMTSSRSFLVPYNSCIGCTEKNYIFIPSSLSDLKIINYVKQWESTLSKNGFHMKTGTVVDFRETEWLSIERNNAIPMLWSYNIDENFTHLPVLVNGKPQYLKKCSETKRLQIPNSNYLIVKRFTTKEEKRRLQCAIHLKDNYPEYDTICAENHLNVISKDSGEMTPDELYGLFVIMNSTYVDRYYRILNGSTQVNATEINSIPMPPMDKIIELGRNARNLNISHLDEKTCDDIIETLYKFTEQNNHYRGEEIWEN